MFQARYCKDFAPTERARPPYNVQTPDPGPEGLGY